MNNGKSGHTYQYAAPPSCPRTISDRLRLFAHISTTTSAKPIAISYDTICAAERSAPRNAYFEFDAQPARMTPYTPVEVSASTYRSPALMFESTSVPVKGITAQAASAGPMESSGAMKNRYR